MEDEIDIYETDLAGSLGKTSTCPSNELFSYTTIIRMRVTTLLLVCLFSPSTFLRTLWLATDPLHE